MSLNEKLRALAKEWEAKAGEVDRPTEPAVSYVEAARLIAGITLRDCAKGLRSLLPTAPASPEATAPDLAALAPTLYQRFWKGRPVTDHEGNETACNFNDCRNELRAISRALSEAREAGRREGIEEAARCADETKPWESASDRIRALATTTRGER